MAQMGTMVPTNSRPLTEFANVSPELARKPGMSRAPPVAGGPRLIGKRSLIASGEIAELPRDRRSALLAPGTNLDDLSTGQGPWSSQSDPDVAASMVAHSGRDLKRAAWGALAGTSQIDQEGFRIGPLEIGRDARVQRGHTIRCFQNASDGIGLIDSQAFDLKLGLFVNVDIEGFPLGVGQSEVVAVCFVNGLRQLPFNANEIPGQLVGRLLCLADTCFLGGWRGILGDDLDRSEELSATNSTVPR